MGLWIVYARMKMKCMDGYGIKSNIIPSILNSFITWFKNLLNPWEKYSTIMWDGKRAWGRGVV